MKGTNPLPREIAPGVFWLGDCLGGIFDGKMFHSYQSLFLIRGEKHSLLIEAGHPKDLEVVDKQLRQVLGDSKLDYLFATHTETPHAGGLGWWLRGHPDLKVIGNVGEFKLIFPDQADRLVPKEIGDVLDLGGVEFEIIAPVLKDQNATQWGLDRRGILFSGDGFAYGHFHQDGQCGQLAEEAKPDTLPIAKLTSLFAEFALYWTRFTDVEPFIADLEKLIKDRGIRLICPTHGLPIGNTGETLPKVANGLRLGAESRDDGRVVL